MSITFLKDFYIINMSTVILITHHSYNLLMITIKALSTRDFIVFAKHVSSFNNLNLPMYFFYFLC